MKIEIWSDYVCPFCYIGKRQLENALEQFPNRDDIEIEFKSFQLDPNTPVYNEGGKSFYEGIAEKYGGGIEQAKKMTEGIEQQAKAVGLDFQFETMKPTNTLDAHRLTKFAREHGKDAALTENLLIANFTDSKDVGNIEVLLQIAEASGLDKDKARAVLQDKNAYADDVRSDIDEAKSLGITGVPYFIFNRKYALSGAQQQDVFVQALTQVFEEEKTIPTFESLSPESNEDGTCGPEGCEVPDQKE